MGFYTSKVAAKKIRHGNKQAITTDSLPADSSPKAALLTDTKQLVPIPQLSLYAFSADSKVFNSKISNFADEVWKTGSMKTSPINFAVDAVADDDNLCLTWLDILCLHQNPEPTLQAEISRFVGKLSEKGWLTAITVSSYIRGIFAARNVAEEYLCYGSTDCFFVVRVIVRFVVEHKPSARAVDNKS